MVQHTQLHLAKQAVIALDMSQICMQRILGSALLESDISIEARHGVPLHSAHIKERSLISIIWGAGDLPGAAVSPRGCPDIGPVFSFAKRPQDLKAVRWPDHGFYDWPEVCHSLLIEFCLYESHSDIAVEYHLA